MRKAQFQDVFERMLRETFKPRVVEMWNMLPADCDRAEVLRAGMEHSLIPMALQMAPKELAARMTKGVKAHERRFREHAPRIMRLLTEEVIKEMS